MYRLFTLLSLLLTQACTHASAATLIATPKDNLQNLINKTSNGDTIKITKGIYNQYDININKSITILGEEYPVFDGQKKHEIFFVTARNVLISGLEIRRTGHSGMVDMAGIKIQNVSYVTVKDCRIFETTYGVYLQNSTHCTIEGNTITSDAVTELKAGNGIHAWKCNSLLIRNISVSNHRDGIYFEFVTESLVHRNYSFDNIRYGLHFMFSHNDTYSYNTFRNNGAGVSVMYTKGITMYRNNFFNNWGDASYAILLKEISDSRIEYNTFQKNTVAIFMEGTNRIHVAWNTFSENGWAMRIQASCSDNTFEKNNFLGNSFDVATNGTMMLNTFTNNYWDKYDGYDLNRDGTGDIPYYPVSIYSVISERIPTAMILYRSFLTNIMDQVEKVMPSVIPDELKDEKPKMKMWKL